MLSSPYWLALVQCCASCARRVVSVGRSAARLTWEASGVTLLVTLSVARVLPRAAQVFTPTPSAAFNFWLRSHPRTALRPSLLYLRSELFWRFWLDAAAAGRRSVAEEDAAVEADEGVDRYEDEVLEGNEGDLRASESESEDERRPPRQRNASAQEDGAVARARGPISQSAAEDLPRGAKRKQTESDRNNNQSSNPDDRHDERYDDRHGDRQAQAPTLRSLKQNDHDGSED